LAATFALAAALGAQAVAAQTGSAAKSASGATSVSPAVQVLLRKASALEARGRLDLASQTWRQVLVTDPNQPDALAGLARWAQDAGRPEEARGYIEKLRLTGRTAVVPVPRIVATGRLEEAGRLARNKQFAEALKIYREVLGDEPPPGPVTIAYYETMAAAPNGMKPAMAGLQKMISRYPGAPEYKVALGRLYTYEAQTRGVGIKMLEALPGDAARAALRQALIWDGPKPANRAAIQAYIAKTPDAELQRLLGEVPKNAPISGPAMSAAESHAYELLNAGKLDEAQARLEEVLQNSPRSVVAMAGLGYIAMKREDFAGAAEYFEVAAAAGPNDKQVKAGLESARFFLHLQNGTRALNAGDTARAKSEFQEAVTLRPNDLIAIRGLSGAEMKLGERAAALPLLERLTKSEPANAEHWRGLFEARLAKDGPKAAIESFRKMPAPMQKALLASVGFQLELASAHFDAGDKADALKTVTQISQSVRKDSTLLGPDERLQLAGLDLALDRGVESEELYREATSKAPDSVVAWEGLLSAQLKEVKEQEAYSTLLSIPVATYQEGLKRNGFLRAAALLQAKYGKPGTADELLKQVLASATPGPERESALLLLASTALARGDAKQADEVATQLVEANPQSIDGWKLLISAKQQEKLSADASEAARRIPPVIAAKLQEDPDFIALLAAVEDSTGESDAALRSIRTAMERFEALHKPQPVGLQIQLAWLLLNSGGDEKELYSTLTSLRMRKDLTPDQTKAYQEIWSVWIRRRSAKARKDGDNKTEVAILDAGSKLLPKDGKIREALAGALLDAGETRRALSVYRGLLNGTPTAEDFAGAVGTALRIKDPIAQVWLKVGLQRYPHEPALIELAGRDAASKGEYSRAQLLWRQALSAQDKETQKQSGALPLNDPQRAVGSALLGQDLTSGPGTPGVETAGNEAPGTFGLFPFIDQKKPKALEEQVQDELSALDGRNAPYLGAGPVLDSRGGTPGFDRRTLVEGDLEASTVVNGDVRVGITVRPATINAGSADGTSTLRLGMEPAGVAFAGQQANGLGGDVEISTETLGLWFGVTPRGFPVQNYIGGLRFRPGKGPITLTVSREPLRDTLLSYAGTRDPVSNQVMGGVIADAAGVRADFGNENSGYYFGGGYQQIRGENVESNSRYDGLLGGYRRVLATPDGSLNVGLFALGLHYDQNLRYFTFGQGGYFSPQRYLLVGVPVTWRGVWARRLEYSLSGAVGPQSFHEDASEYFPTMPLLQGRNGPYYSALTSTGLNYNLEFKWLYQFNPNWFLGGLLNINNSRNYAAQSLSFFLRYSPKARTLGSDYWLPSVPDWKGKQPFHLE
jgi:tetratricopeptide (TPR) repeat protein